MLTGTEEEVVCDEKGNIVGNIVRCAHILPHRWKNDTASMLKSIGFSVEDLESARNGIFLCEGFERGLDENKLCFVRREDFFYTDRIVLKVLNSKACKEIPIFQGSTESVDNYDGNELNLQCGRYEHKPFRTALYVHAVQAHRQIYGERKVSSYCDPRGADLLYDVSPERLPNMSVDFMEFARSVTKLYSSINREILNEIREDDEEESVDVVKEEEQEEDNWHNENSCRQGEEEKGVAEVHDEVDGAGLKSV
jgi:hypothetical protein